MAYKHVIRAKTKNLFDISKIVESTNLKNNKDGTITVSVYGVSGGLLKNLCPELKVGDVIKVYFQPLRWTATNPPLVMVVGDVIFDRKGNSKLTVTEKSLNKPVLFYNNHYDERGLPGVTIIGNILITTDLTITNKNHNERYTPYNYLQSNKRMIKVSNVCQLLDKSKYNLPHTESGLTFTAGTDGSIIVNGTCTSSVWANISSFELNPEHTFILIGCPGTNVNDVALYTQDPAADEVRQWEEGRGSLVTGNFYKNKANYLYIRILTGYVCNNLTFKPQLYDLTEMYGAGHEPTTVAEFRQRFPNEYYPYSPQCWLTSYKSAVVCKTKNLFDYSKVNNLMYIGGFSINQYFIKNGNKFTVTYPMSKGATYLDYIMPLKAGTYTLSLLAYGTVSGAKNGYFGLVKVENDYKVLKYNKYAKIWLSSNARQSYTLTIEEDGNYAVYAYSTYANSTNLDCTFWDIQLELGDTATDYVPYGHL